MLATKVVAYRHGPPQDSASAAVRYVDVEETLAMEVGNAAAVEAALVLLLRAVRPENGRVASTMSRGGVLHSVVD